MAAKRLLVLCVLVVTGGLTGCRHWCERQYPCPAPAYPTTACVPCVPCCPPGTSGYGGSVPAPPAPVDFRSSGRMDCTCTPAAR